MAKLKDFNLALGVINNILVCDKDNNIVFAGDEICAVLFHDSGDYRPKLLDNFPDRSIREALSEKIEEVRKCKCTQHYLFESYGETVFIFPGNYNQSEHIVLSTKEQILLANKIENDLKERVKELECLYIISNELELTKDLQTALQRSLQHLVKAFQYPDFAVVSIEVDGTIYGSKDCDELKEDRRLLSEDIMVNGQKRGKVEVCYLQGAEFLPEEIKLVREIAHMVSRNVDKEDAKGYLNTQRKLLLDQNEELTELTESLRTTNDKLNVLFRAITDTIVVIDPDFNILMSNKEEIGSSGKCYKKLFNSSNICSNCPTMRVFRGAEPASEEKRVKDQYFMLQSYPILGSRGNVEKVIEICRSVTKEKQMEQQLIQSYKLASLGKLVAGVAHEINNPNTFIRGNINIISEAFQDILPILDRAAQDDPSLKIARLDYELFKENIPILIEDMVGGANRIKKIVDGLRNFAKKDEGGLTDAVDINNVIQNNLRITEKEVRKHARIKENLSSDIPVFKGSVSKLEQVMMNMLINASHAITGDKGLIILETGYDENANEVFVKISDNGKGIDEKTRHHIFDPFFTTKRDRGGTGLGLSISYGIIHEHNGRIQLQSEVGKGTTFTISIPVVPPDNPKVKEKNKKIK